MDQSDPAALIQLIQEMNQSNNELLQRVSQLETELEESQRALQAEIGRAQEEQSFMLPEHQDTTAMQQQIGYLLTQLEYTQQTNQRHEILIEALTGQLEASQERVIQLEESYNHLQERYTEQAQRLMQAENGCQDLRSRLQRQQRYTLQFKAALEKCLEVPPPSYGAEATAYASEVLASTPTESAHESSAASPPPSPSTSELPREGWSFRGGPVAQPFLPKVDQIRPWSLAANAQANAPSDAPSTQEQETESEPSSLKLPKPSTELKLRNLLHVEALPELPELMESPLSPLAPAAEQAALAPQPGLSEAQIAEISGMLSQHNSADWSANWSAEADDAPQPAAAEPHSESHTHLQAEATPEVSAEVSAEASALIAESEPNVEVHRPSDPELKEDEDQLWRDLAQLVETSARDVIHARASQDFSEFDRLSRPEIPPYSPPRPAEPAAPKPAMPKAEAQPPNVSQPIAEPKPVAPPAQKSAAVEQPVPVSATAHQAAPHNQEAISQEAVAEPSTKPEEEASGDESLNQPNWPSPIVNPYHPLRKRESLAAVELPSFPKR